MLVVLLIARCCRDKVNTESGLINVLGALYASVLFFAVINALIVQPVLSAERAVSYRERAAGMYSFWPWTLAIVSTPPPLNVPMCLGNCTSALHIERAASTCMWLLWTIAIVSISPITVADV